MFTRGLVGATLQARKASLYDSSLTPRALSPLKPSDSWPCGPPATRLLVSARTPEGRTTKPTKCKKKKKKNLYCFHTMSKLLSLSEFITVPGVLSWETSGTTMRVPVKSQRSPACAVSTASALRTISRERGIEPRGSSACVSWMRTWTGKSWLQSETSGHMLPSVHSLPLYAQKVTFWKSMNLDLCVSRWKRERLLQTGFLQMVGGEYLNCCGTSLITAWQSMHRKVPLTWQHKLVIMNGL